MKALSIRQPWAWLIIHGPKRIENRGWPTLHRGPFLIHASKGMTNREYLETKQVADDLGVKLPPMEELPRGGIVGKAHLVGCVTDCRDPWFCGPVGFKLDKVEPLPFRPLKGQLGFFNVEEAA